VPGKVYLVGAGPGDAGLLTLRAKRLLGQADAVVYDRLLSPRLLNFVPSTAEAFYVGKEASHHSLPQRDIEALLIRLAQTGKRVVRLKGGDPFVYGRGGEEGIALATAGIPFEVIPGVTSAVSVPAYAGIPVTHRQVATSFTIMTGHEVTESGEVTGASQAVYNPLGTLVVLMGVAQLPHIVNQLLAAARAPDTPVAIIRWGTRAQQATLTGSLGTIVDQVTKAGFTAPAIIVIGEVVNLRDQLAWAESRPLYGRRILVCAESEQLATEAADAVEDLGGEAFELSAERLDAAGLHEPPGLQALLHSWDLLSVDEVWQVSTVHDTSDWMENGLDRVVERLTLSLMQKAAIQTHWHRVTRYGDLTTLLSSAAAEFEPPVEVVPQ
jgi:uroporphyrinogen III methyltransferase / synthase